MAMKLPSLLFAGVLVVAACTPHAASPKLASVPDTNQCSAMCLQLQILGCAEGKPLYDSDVAGPQGVPNETCEQDCTKQQGNGVFYNPMCVKHVAACSEIEAARKKTCSD